MCYGKCEERVLFNKITIYGDMIIDLIYICFSGPIHMVLFCPIFWSLIRIPMFVCCLTSHSAIFQQYDGGL